MHGVIRKSYLDPFTPGFYVPLHYKGNTFPHIVWPLLKGGFLVVFRIWRGTSSSLEHILVFCEKDIIADTSASDD